TDIKYVRLRLDDFLVSRRSRHTRCNRDWSSDVCSSDLASATSWLLDVHLKSLRHDPEHQPVEQPGRGRGEGQNRAGGLEEHPARSEERRVGEESSSWRGRTRRKKTGRGKGKMRRKQKD